jgi:23S rRNA (adenine2503-C2)-methyltransferase
MIHPVLSTMLPKQNKRLMEYLNAWCDIKNETYRGDAGLQFSINSTNEFQRAKMFSGNALTLNEISEIGNLLPAPKGRKYALNFALADDYIVDAELLATLFNQRNLCAK